MERARIGGSNEERAKWRKVFECYWKQVFLNVIDNETHSSTIHFVYE